jgi:hypothetical protein
MQCIFLFFFFGWIFPFLLGILLMSLYARGVLAFQHIIPSRNLNMLLESNVLTTNIDIYPG